MRTPAAPTLGVLVALALALAGCRSGGPERVAFPASRYHEAFDITLETLRDAQYAVERVDYDRGVIATRPKSTAGLATPWDPDQANLGQEWQDLVDDQWRIVRAWFAVGNELAPAFAGPPDTGDPPMTLVLDVTIYRAQRHGLRVETEAVGLQSTSIDLTALQRGQLGDRLAPVRGDRPLARRLMGTIERRLAKAASRAQAAADPAP